LSPDAQQLRGSKMSAWMTFLKTYIFAQKIHFNILSAFLLQQIISPASWAFGGGGVAFGGRVYLMLMWGQMALT